MIPFKFQYNLIKHDITVEEFSLNVFLFGAITWAIVVYTQIVYLVELIESYIFKLCTNLAVLKKYYLNHGVQFS